VTVARFPAVQIASSPPAAQNFILNFVPLGGDAVLFVQNLVFRLSFLRISPCIITE
jgi:hypothetical protein